MNAMKTTLFLLCLLFSSAAFGQSYLPPSTLSPSLQMATHGQRASQQPMAQELDLREHSGFTYAQGERPLWEVMPLPQLQPLGDIARELRKEHETVKKAAKVSENY
jgi:hypothetical protein